MPFTVAIIGRPNVGKSTLFNRLVGRRLALVDGTPGVTRDRREGAARLGDLRFTAIDTAGLAELGGESLEARMRAQTERAVADADVTLMLIDARAGVTPLDRHFAGWLRASGRPVLLIANKCEGGGGLAGVAEAYALGLGDPLPLSAEHGEGLGELYAALAPFVPSDSRGDGEVPEDVAAAGGGERAPGPLRLAIVGRPNVGKSTLVNRLVGSERLLTGPEPGITRDAIAVAWSFRGQRVELVDTAGLRRKAKVVEKLEALSAADAVRAVGASHVVVLVLDARMPLERQDLAIARTAVDEGRALVIAANKWDLVADRAGAVARLTDRIERSLPQVRGLPTVFLSALTGEGVGRLMPAVLAVYSAWNRRVATADLNRWLARATEDHPPPLAQGRAVRLRYATQPKTRPPSFVLFANRPSQLAESYLRYLANGLRESFDLRGVPIRIHIRKGRNPYARA